MTGLDYAILGLLADGEKTGYDVLKIFKASPSLHWKSTAGSIYPALSRLERQRLVAGEIIHYERRPSRRVFRLSDSGRKVFLLWLTDKTASEDPRDAHSMLLKLVFSHHVGWRETIALLKAYRDRMGEQLTRVESALAQCQKFGPLHQCLALANTVESLRAQLRWVEMAIARLGGEAEQRVEGSEPEDSNGRTES